MYSVLNWLTKPDKKLEQELDFLSVDVLILLVLSRFKLAQFACSAVTVSNTKSNLTEMSLAFDFVILLTTMFS